METHALAKGDSQSLAVLGKEIQTAFDLVLKYHDKYGLKLPGFLPASWEHELERFELWANNLGLHHRGHSSLDYRLREVEALKNIIYGLLQDMKTTLDERKSLFISPYCRPCTIVGEVVSAMKT
jgi:hypothetical protein